MFEVLNIPVWLFLLCLIVPCIVSGLIGFAIGKDIKKLKSSVVSAETYKKPLGVDVKEHTATDFTLGEVLLSARPQKPKNRENKGKNKSREVVHNGRF